MMNSVKNDSDYIRSDNVELFCNTNAHLLNGSPRGIVLGFPGLGGYSCIGGSMDMGQYNGTHAEQLAKAGLLLAYTFPGPWSWMNRGAVKMTDLLVAALREKYSLSNDSPLEVSGGSMGGQGAIMYALRSGHKVTACAAACPCYDVPKAFDVRPEFPRTFLRAVADYDEPFETALRSISPAHHVGELPDIPYFITCDEEDEIFPMDGMNAFVADMKLCGLKVDYRRMPGLGHGEFTDEVRSALTQFLIDSSMNK